MSATYLLLFDSFLLFIRSYNPMTKLSIITVCYNDRDGLTRTIASLRAQDFLEKGREDIQFIVIDGGSQDASLEVIKQNTDYIGYWVSEPDDGIYNAMNKGVAVAQGEYTIFMNSGDLFYDSKVLSRFFVSSPTADLISGDWVGYKCGKKNVYWCAPRRLDLPLLIQQSIPHNSTFIRTSLLRSYPYREDYRIVSDWIFFFTAYIDGKATYSQLNFPVCKGDQHGLSSSNLDLGLHERERFFNTIMPSNIHQALLTMVKEEQLILKNSFNSRTLSRVIDFVYRTESLIIDKLLKKHSRRKLAKAITDY